MVPELSSFLTPGVGSEGQLYSAFLWSSTCSFSKVWYIAGSNETQLRVTLSFFLVLGVRRDPQSSPLLSFIYYLSVYLFLCLFIRLFSLASRFLHFLEGWNGLGFPGGMELLPH